MACDIRIGTSGFHYKHWKGPFYPQKMPDAAMLDFYTQHFDTLELNNSFYRLPTVTAFESWRDATPHLGAKLGPMLFQLPPKWRVNPERLRNLLMILPRDIRYAFEFRELSWMTSDVSRILQEFNAALCIYELAGYRSSLSITADFTYVRLHGPESGKYQGSYTEQQLCEWARQIELWAKELKAIYFYFDNDQAGYAAANALRLREMVFGRRLERAC